MTINQLSIFIENRSGTLIKVLEVLKQSGIQIVASTIADTAEYGIYRLICSEPLRAYEELKKAGIAVAQSDVFAIELACLYFPCLQPQSAWLKLRLLLLDSPSLAPLALMRRRFFLPAEARLIMEQLGEP